MYTYNAYTEKDSQPFELQFTYYNFAIPPLPGDTIDISHVPSEPDLWQIVRRHWYDGDKMVLIVRRPQAELGNA